MRQDQLVTITFSICLSIFPPVVAILGTSCIDLANTMNKLPGLFVEHSQKLVCDAGCEPRLDLWDKFTKSDVIKPLVADGAAYCGVPEGTEAGIEAFDQMFRSISNKCGDKLGASHLCDHPERLQPFMDCVQANAFSSSMTSLPKLVPFMSEHICKSAKEYITSERLWEHDFVKHASKYVHQCHEL